MKSNRWIEISRRVYAHLLYLYPQEHRLEYGPLMLQAFADQCLAASRAGAWGLVALWFRTLADLGISALREQVASPRTSWGLLESVPNEPLPWKGVALVLVPGLVFFVAQVGQLTGQTWFLLMVYRAGYFLIIPVLLTWFFTRKFPIWGLIPLGLFFNTAWDFGYRLQVQALDPYNPAWQRLMGLVYNTPSVEKIVMVAGLSGLMILLVWLAARRGGISRGAWIWIGINILLVASKLAYTYLSEIQWYAQLSDYYMDKGSFIASLIGHLPYDFYSSAGFLFLILLGTLLVRKYGRLTLLLPLGYLLPTILVGSYPDQTPNLFWICAAVLVYRLLIAVAAPVWIVRSASDHGQKRAGTVALAVGIGIPVLLRIFEMGWDWKNLLNSISAISDLLIVSAGIALALTLYNSAPPEQSLSTRRAIQTKAAEN
jgi:hypothetical protein